MQTTEGGGIHDLVIEKKHNYSIMPLNDKGQQKVDKFIAARSSSSKRDFSAVQDMLAQDQIY